LRKNPIGYVQSFLIICCCLGENLHVATHPRKVTRLSAACTKQRTLFFLCYLDTTHHQRKLVWSELCVLFFSFLATWSSHGRNRSWFSFLFPLLASQENLRTGQTKPSYFDMICTVLRSDRNSHHQLHRK
jgi:hypothetical protein